MNSAAGQFRSCLIFVGLACFVLFGSVNATDGNPHAKVRTQVARLGREFNLKAGQEMTPKGGSLRIKFAEVKEDSRCPSDVTCVWAGNAAVRVEVGFRGKASTSLTLNSMANSPPADYRGYRIKLVGLSPYPRSNRSIAAGDYAVTLLVSKE
jgi:hypothetical protein